MDTQGKIAEIRRRYIERHEERFDDFVVDVLADAESPIEELFGAALFAELCDAETVLPSFLFWSGSPPEGWSNYVALQVPVPGYRPDFFICCDKNGGGEVMVVVECDGHEYHERTKEQARRDRRRDRWIQGAGIHILRFTGSELWADAQKCAREVAAFIHKKRFE